MDFSYFIELFFSGLTRGSIYALIALGYTMVYGIIGLINFAHGEIYMIGAFTAFIVATVLSIYGFPLLAIIIIAGVAAAVWSSAYGYTIEKIAYKPLRHARGYLHSSVPLACPFFSRIMFCWHRLQIFCHFPP
ncbi:hypothetical protein DGMP_15110 [Desulfomarina profundi]|uniref:Branched-chain amino acid ABC transporter permease LivH n=1 Tax=Desulfomarina profundi TaxID=2772557 RepID=A0A8D5FKR9_9BACT|nr:hypothetical protein [Desulfomarina profundi]BCL60818.1 hypothetical protein DGMP_15110 [Desulfomarina profundi]